jgi:hypothetical protein
MGLPLAEQRTGYPLGPNFHGVKGLFMAMRARHSPLAFAVTVPTHLTATYTLRAFDAALHPLCHVFFGRQAL